MKASNLRHLQPYRQFLHNYIKNFPNVNIEYIEFFRYNRNIMYKLDKKTTIYSSFLIFLIRLNLKIVYKIHSNLIYAYTTILTVL